MSTKLPSIKKGGKKGDTAGSPASPKGKKNKKEPLNLFPSVALLDYHDQVQSVNPEDIRNGEFDATQLYFNPSQQRGECSMTLAFRCTAKIVRGDTVMIRLGGFKGGKPQVFALESRPNDEYEKLLKDMHEKTRAKQTSLELRFQAYYSGENPPKGCPPQVILLRCRHAVEENMRVVVGIPESVHICLPDKIAANSAKIKIEGTIMHASGGKIPKAPFHVTGEVRKRPIEADIAELEELIGFYAGGQRSPKKSRAAAAADGENGGENAEGADGEAPAVEEEEEEDIDDEPVEDLVDMDIVEEITRPEADQIIENATHRRHLQMGLRWVVDNSVYHSYEESCQFVAKALNEAYERAKRSSDELFLHRELAKNFDVKLSQIVILEDTLNTTHGAYYPSHSRAAVMCMRLYTMESHDIGHMLGVLKPPCVYREIHSAIRSKNVELLDKWAYYILAMSTTPMNLREYTFARETYHSLYVGVKDLPHDELVRISKLKRDDFYMTTNFLSCSANVDIEDEDFSPPDTGVLFELRGVLNAVEIGDCSYYPNDKEWLVPMFSSFVVAGVENYPNKNHVIKVTLDFRGSFGGLSDLKLPPTATEDRNRFKMAVSISGSGGISLALRKMAQTTALITKCIYANLRLRECRMRQPQHLLHAKYLAQYTATTRLSKATQNIEEGHVKWFYALANTAPTSLPDAPAYLPWALMKTEVSIAVEKAYLLRTRAQATFEYTKALNPVTTIVQWQGDFNKKEYEYRANDKDAPVPAMLRREVGKTIEFPFDNFI